MLSRARAPAKVILLGEHAVVYHYPALVAAVDLYSHATAIPSDSLKVSSEGYSGKELGPVRAALSKFLEDNGLEGVKVEISSEVPKGMGSSSSTAAAAVKATAKLYGIELSPDQLRGYVDLADKLAHGRSSGVDSFAVSHGGIHVYRRVGDKITFEKVRVEPFYLLVVDSGIKGRTSEAVKRFAEEGRRKGEKFYQNLEKLGKIVIEAKESLEAGDIETLGKKMVAYSEILKNYNLLVPELEELIEVLGSYGLYAKPTGAWMGGVVIAVGDSEKILRAREEMRDRGYRSFILKAGVGPD